MKRCLYPTLILFMLFASCKKDKTVASVSPKVTSTDYIDNLLFVPKNYYAIQTNGDATFSSSDPHIVMTSDGAIHRITSGEVVAIDITWKDTKFPKTTIYALGATDNNQDYPAKTFHGELATDAYSNFVEGWKTLEKLPVTNETYAIVMRHSDASHGLDYPANHVMTTPPPNWWKSPDSLLARQLNAQGIQRATDLGQIFKDLNYPITRVVTSEFQRAIQTAQLMNIGPTIGIDYRINHPSHNVYAPGLFSGVRDILHEQPIDNKMTLIVTHHPSNEPMGLGYATFPEVAAFDWAAAYFIKIAPDSTITYQGSASWGMFKYWRNLKLHK